MQRSANARRVTNAAAPESGARPKGVFRGWELRELDFRELLDGRVGVAIDAATTAPRRTHHSPRDGFRGNGAIDLATAREQGIDQRRQHAACEFERPHLFARS